MSTLAEGGTLCDLLKERSGTLADHERMRFVRQLAAGMSCLHSDKRAEVAHRDLKSLNILMRRGTCTISDFGLSKEDDGATVTSTVDVLGTPAWSAPKVLMGLVSASGAAFMADAYSFGCPPEIKALLAACWEHEPTLRPTMAKIEPDFPDEEQEREHTRAAAFTHGPPAFSLSSQLTLSATTNRRTSQVSGIAVTPGASPPRFFDVSVSKSLFQRAVDTAGITLSTSPQQTIKGASRPFTL
ncbi:kinase-like domain-containing protein [Baffinella frigidus]|nr:kinase-like domain-containing protein [Cryptophyta sp. CCMP2293]